MIKHVRTAGRKHLSASTLRWLVLFSLVGFSSCSSTPTSFSFLVTSDTHYAKRGQYEADAKELSPKTASTWESSEKTFRPLLETLKRQVNETAPHPLFWFSTGDLVNAGHFGASMNDPIAVPGMERVYGDLIDDLKKANVGVPLINAKGNNEAKGTSALSAYDEIFLPYMSKGLRQEIERPYFSFNHLNSHFIILDEFPRELFEESERLPFDLGEEQLVWLRGDLEANRTAEHVFIFHHTPVIPPIPGSHIHYRNPDNRKRYVSLLLEFDVRIVFVGHNHSLGILEYREKDNSFVQVMSNSRNLEKPKASYVRNEYDPADLRGDGQSPVAQSIYGIAQEYAPNIRKYYFARHLPGHLLVQVEAQNVRITAFLGTTQNKYREWVISRDPHSGSSTISKF